MPAQNALRITDWSPGNTSYSNIRQVANCWLWNGQVTSSGVAAFFPVSNAIITYFSGLGGATRNEWTMLRDRFPLLPQTGSITFYHDGFAYDDQGDVTCPAFGMFIKWYDADGDEMLVTTRQRMASSDPPAACNNAGAQATIGYGINRPAGAESIRVGLWCSTNCPPTSKLTAWRWGQIQEWGTADQGDPHVECEGDECPILGPPAPPNHVNPDGTFLCGPISGECKYIDSNKPFVSRAAVPSCGPTSILFSIPMLEIDIPNPVEGFGELLCILTQQLPAHIYNAGVFLVNAAIDLAFPGAGLTALFEECHASVLARSPFAEVDDLVSAANAAFQAPSANGTLVPAGAITFDMFGRVVAITFPLAWAMGLVTIRPVLAVVICVYFLMRAIDDIENSF